MRSLSGDAGKDVGLALFALQGLQNIVRENKRRTPPPPSPVLQILWGKGFSLFKDSVQALSKEINKATSFKSFWNNGLFHFPPSL